MAGEPDPVDGRLTFLDPLLDGAPLVVGSGRWLDSSRSAWCRTPEEDWKADATRRPGLEEDEGARAVSLLFETCTAGPRDARASTAHGTGLGESPGHRGHCGAQRGAGIAADRGRCGAGCGPWHCGARGATMNRTLKPQRPRPDATREEYRQPFSWRCCLRSFVCSCGCPNEDSDRRVSSRRRLCSVLTPSPLGQTVNAEGRAPATQAPRDVAQRRPGPWTDRRMTW